MSSIPHSQPVAAPSVCGALDLSRCAVVLATDGSVEAIAATHVAHALATKYGAAIHVVRVVNTRPAPIPPPIDVMLAIGDAIGGPSIHDQQIQQIRAAIETAVGQSVDWPVSVLLGSPAPVIIHEAQRIGAALIIVGLRKHGPMDRALHDETALNVMKSAPCPVLAIVAGMTALPVRVLVALDFSDASLIAARAARAVVGDGASFVLAYVPPLTALLEPIIHDLGVQTAFTQIVQELRSDAIAIDQVVLQHDVPRPAAEAILEYADAMHSDLIAAGSIHHGQIDRWMFGSVSSDLVRDARRSVLIVPPIDVSHP